MLVDVDVPAVGVRLGLGPHVQTHEDLSIDVVGLDAIHRLADDIDVELLGDLGVALDGCLQLSAVIILELPPVVLHGAGIARLGNTTPFCRQIPGITSYTVTDSFIGGVSTPSGFRLRHT